MLTASAKAASRRHWSHAAHCQWQHLARSLGGSGCASGGLRVGRALLGVQRRLHGTRRPSTPEGPGSGTFKLSSIVIVPTARCGRSGTRLNIHGRSETQEISPLCGQSSWRHCDAPLVGCRQRPALQVWWLHTHWQKKHERAWAQLAQDRTHVKLHHLRSPERIAANLVCHLYTGKTMENQIT